MNARRNCCRLCLAPEEECVPIFNNFAADRQRLDQKILSCVHIKVLQEDHLSQKICHACISYLNSWQSFKNRCDAAERKQKSWTDIGRIVDSADRNAVVQHVKELCPGVTIESIPQKAPAAHGHSLEKPEHRQLREKLEENGVQISTSSKQLDVKFIKEEPREADEENDERNVVMELDPSQFLLQSQNEDEEDDEDYDEGDMSGRCADFNSSGEGGPPILASLGLHHVTPDGFGNTSENENADDDVESLHRQMLATCSVCDMTFSNRANARRHERNIHGLRQNPANPLSAQVPQTTLDYCETVAANRASNNTAIISTATGIPSIDLKQKFRMKLKSQRETYDYSNPSKYRHLVTPNRLAFILRNIEFLEQAQNMTCKCCNKTYPSYKYFMGHMRKKYQNLPRNVCFKCLRQFSSKGQFIGHLKRKSCINLYAIVMADDSIPKVPPTNVGTEVPGTKEVISNKSYGCKLCNKEFKPKINLRQHVLEAHPEVQRSKEIPDVSCAFCQQVFEDPVVRRKHYNNLDCIMFIVCCSCGERFDNHTAYVDHVYQHHLPPQLTGHDEYGYELFDQDGNSSSSHLRNPQNCPVCNKQYNNYYNVLRHMESKHPNQLPQIYQCTKCSEGFPRQSELRDHLHNTHGETAIRQPKQQLTSQHLQLYGDPTKPIFVCKECGQTFGVLSEWIDHQGVEHSKFNCIRCDFQSDNREAFAIHCFMEHRNFSHGSSKVQLYSCRQCSNTYKSIDSLQDHLQTQHNLSSADSKTTSGNNGCNDLPNAFDVGGIRPGEPNAHAESASNVVSEGVNLPPICKTFNCGLCAFVLTDLEALRQHMSKIHGMDKKFFYCNQCNAKFMNDKGLRVHLFRLHGVRDDSIPVNTGTSLLKPVQQTTVQHAQLPASNDVDSTDHDVKNVALNECSVCHTVYKNSEQLKLHKQSVHGETEKVTNTEEKTMHESQPPSVSTSPFQPPLWFQCRYCAESFNTSKKLTIHMNTHEEYDKSDHSCKDCGGVYSTKKSLWVHRYKKHPKIPDASPCDNCPRVFFDKTELFYHTSQAHVRGVSNNETNGNSNGADFHEMQCASDALFSMLDTTGSMGGETTRSATQKADETVYQCDMCPKTFLILNALQVHRGWHFRSPDGRKVRDPNDIWQPDQLPPSKVKRMSQSHRTPSIPAPASVPAVPVPVEKNPPTCPYCHSTFASGNNLKRHIVEVHKRAETKSIISTSASPTANPSAAFYVEKVRECTTCTLKFSTVAEWVDHKLNHARVQKPSPTFEWCCELCGKAFTRKERLLQHILSHLNSKEFEEGENGSTSADDANRLGQSESDEHSQSNNLKEPSSSIVKIKEEDTRIKEEEVPVKEEEDEEDTNVKEEEDEEIHNNDIIEEEFVEDEEDDMDDNDDSNDEESEDEGEEDKKTSEQYFCELCQVHFASSNSLRQHVSEHFVNGGLGGTVLFTQRAKSHRTSTDSTSSSNSSNSNSTSSSENSSSDVTENPAIKQELP